MANTHGESSMEEFAAKALPELEDLLERFKNQNKPEAPEPEPEPVKRDHDADGLSDDAERIEDLCHIIWHLASRIEDIAYHDGRICSKIIGDIQVIKRQVTYINDSLDGRDDEPGF